MSGKQTSWRCTHVPFSAALAVCTALMALLACAVLAPHVAIAKSYTCEQINLDAYVADDGTLSVTERRTFDFDGSFTLVGFILDPPVSGELKVKGVTVSNSAGGQTALEKVKFETGWRSAGGPGGDQYAIDKNHDTVYCFSHYSNGVYSVTVDYQYTNAVTVYTDVTELYWQFIGKNMEVDSNDVSLKVTLPVPAGQSVVGGDNVRAWGHGPLDGNVGFQDDGTVLFTAPKVASGTFAEARVTFPASWTPGASPDVRKSEAGLEGILAEEKGWADEANRERMLARAVSFGPGGLSLVALIGCIVMFFRRGREYKPEFQGDYWRDVPEKGMPPAAVGRVVRWNEESTNDFTATLMSLSARGYIRMEKRTVTVEKRHGKTETVEDYVLVPTGKSIEELTGLERKAYNFIFKTVGYNSGSVAFNDLSSYGKRNPQGFVNSMQSWQDKLSEWVDSAGIFETEGDKWCSIFRAVAVGVVILGIAVYFFTDNLLAFGASLPLSIVTFIFAKNIKRRSKTAAEINAKAKALRRWFKDFTNLKEAVPTDTKVWGELLVYAYVLGVAKEAIANLRVAVPHLWDDDWFYGYSYWYWAPDHSTPYCDRFDTSLSSTYTSARAAISSDSSSSGGGGGFSGGGGGGFGGGGGGFAR